MGDESPGDPPDPSPPLFSQSPDLNNSERGTKRPAENVSNDRSAKKIITDLSTPSASIETVYTHPSIVIEERTYSKSDKGPFIVHISRVEPDTSAGLSLRPIKVGLTLVKSGIRNIVKDGIKSVGRNRIAVQFKTADAANCFLTHPCLKNNKLSAVIPSYNVSRMGLIRGVPQEWSMSDLIDNMDALDNESIVLKARRLNRKIFKDGQPSWIPTQSVAVTVSGQILPKYVYVCHSSMLVETYLLPTIQCHNCCRFGHVKNQCRSKPRCFKCGKEHTGDNCEVNSESTSCLLCTGKHLATDSKCPEHVRQRNIKLIMSEQNISYIEASAQVPAVRRSYADVASAMFSPVSAPIPNMTPSSKSISYKKTVFSTPHARSTPTPGYDRNAHNQIIQIPVSSTPNGCALQALPVNIKPNDNILEIILSLITAYISQNKSQVPSNVAPQILPTPSIVVNNDSSDSSMEL